MLFFILSSSSCVEDVCLVSLYLNLLTQAASTGSSVDPDKPVEHMEVQQSGSGQDSAAAQTKTSDGDKSTKAGSKDSTTSNTTAAPPPKRW